MTEHRTVYARKKPLLWLRSFLNGEKCALCGKNTTKGLDVICPDCLQRLTAESLWVCPLCGAAVRDCVCATPLMRDGGIDAFAKLFPYMSDSGLLNPLLLYRLKNVPDAMLAERMMRELVPQVQGLCRKYGFSAKDCLVTFLPRSPERLRVSGTDQSKALAKALAADCGFEFCRMFRRMGGETQKSLGSGERRMNAVSAFTYCAEPDLSGKCVIITDDLVTSGATVSGCAGMLKHRGADCVFCAALAHTAGRYAGYFPLKD